MRIIKAYAGSFEGSHGVSRRVLITVQKLPVPWDGRVWREATELSAAGYAISVICPVGFGYTASYELIEDIAIYRYQQLGEGKRVFGYLLEYLISLFWVFLLTWRVFFERGF